MHNYCNVFFEKKGTRITILHPKFGLQFFQNVSGVTIDFKKTLENPKPFQKAYEWTFNHRNDFDIAVMPFLITDKDLWGNEEHFILVIYDKNGICRQPRSCIIIDPKKKKFGAKHPFYKLIRYAIATLLPENYSKLTAEVYFSQENYHEQPYNDQSSSGAYCFNYLDNFLSNRGQVKLKVKKIKKFI